MELLGARDFPDFHFHAFTEPTSEWDTVEVMTIRATVDGGHIEENDEAYHHPNGQQRANNYGSYPLLLHTCFQTSCLEASKGKDGKRDEKTKDEAKDVSVIVYHWQKAENEKAKDEAKDFNNGPLWVTHE